MSYYGEWDAIASEDWGRMDECKREYVLEGMGLPKSEAACEWTQLRTQTKEALIEDALDAAKDTASMSYYTEDSND